MRSLLVTTLLLSCAAHWSTAPLNAAHPHAAPGVTSLTNATVKYTVPSAHHVLLRRGPIRR